jgi:hypothetical protein
MMTPWRFAIEARRPGSGGVPDAVAAHVWAPTNFPQESLELYRREAHEHARRLGTSTDERMRYARRAERELPRRQIHARVADVHREISLEHVEPFVLVRVDVPRGPEAGRNEDLDEAVAICNCRSHHCSFDESV